MWVQGQRVGVLVATYSGITYQCTNVVTHKSDMWAGLGEPLTCRASVSLEWRDIWHLHASTDTRCELQNSPARLLPAYQSPLQKPDWLIPLANA